MTLLVWVHSAAALLPSRNAYALNASMRGLLLIGSLVVAVLLVVSALRRRSVVAGSGGMSFLLYGIAIGWLPIGLVLSFIHPYLPSGAFLVGVPVVMAVQIFAMRASVTG